MARQPRAALDIGSNTIRLLVASYAPPELHPILDESAFVRLGLGVDQEGSLRPDREEAAITAIRDLLTKARDMDVDSVIAVATSAVRDARNGQDFVDRVQGETKIHVQILSGEREAELTFLGATGGTLPIRGAIVVDLGGGSAEFIASDDRGMQWAQSVKLGSGRLTERFVQHDPPTEEELRTLKAAVGESLRSLPAARPLSGLFTGGTASHVAILLGKSGRSIQLTLEDLMGVLDTLRRSSSAEIVEQFHIRPERASVLPVGVQTLVSITSWYGLQQVTITQGGIREGAILDSYGVASG